MKDSLEVFILCDNKKPLHVFYERQEAEKMRELLWTQEPGRELYIESHEVIR